MNQPVREVIHHKTSVLQEETALLFQRSACATVLYHDLLRMPLTAVEVWRFGIRPHGYMGPAPSLQNIEAALQALVATGVLCMRNGFYTIPGHEDDILARRKKHALAQIKWKRLRRVAWWLQGVPFIRMVAGSGSLAREVVREGSDLDVLLVVEPGRMWTTRFLVTVLLDLFRIRRRPTGETNNRVCLNHYVTLDSLKLPYHSLYTAYEYARLVPLVGADVCTRFRNENREWMETYLFRVLLDDAPHQKQIKPSRLLHSIQAAGEWLLGGGIGKALERVLGNFQAPRILRGRAHGGRVVATAEHLEFHPHSHEAPMLHMFNMRMLDIGFREFGEQKDSGLSS